MNNYGELWICSSIAAYNALALLTSQEEHLLFTLRCASMGVGVIGGVLGIIAAVFRFVRWIRQKPD